MHKYAFFHKRTQGGVYYGGTIAGPVMKELLGNILPYLGIEPVYNEKELKMEEVQLINVPLLIDKKVGEAKNELQKLGLKWDIKGDGNIITNQFPSENEKININSKIILYTE